MAGPDTAGAPAAPDAPKPAEAPRLRRLTGVYGMIPPIAALLLIVVSVNHFFILEFFVRYTLLDNQYLFILIGLLVPLVFLYWPALPSLSKEKAPFYGLALALITAGLCVWFVIHGNQVVDDGWEYEAPPVPTILSGVLWVLILEATRRAGG